MQVLFQTTSSLARKVSNLRKAITKPEIGWDRDFWSEATLFEALPNGQVLRHRRQETEVLPGDSSDYAVELIRRGALAVWQTAWSGFHYALLREGTETTPSVWAFIGGGRGYLAQNLLPDMKPATILCVESSFGSFYGPTAMRDYWRVRAEWCAVYPDDSEMDRMVREYNAADTSARLTVRNHGRDLLVKAALRACRDDLTAIIKWTAESEENARIASDQPWTLKGYFTPATKSGDRAVEGINFVPGGNYEADTYIADEAMNRIETAWSYTDHGRNNDIIFASHSELLDILERLAKEDEETSEAA